VGGTFSHADVDAGLGVVGCCGGGGGVGTACTGVAHCGQTVASSGMEAPHLKQNISHLAPLPPVAQLNIWDSADENYFIHIEKAITSIARGITFVMQCQQVIST
jgi:hypothetical protein